MEHGLTDSLSPSWMGSSQWKRTVHRTESSSFNACILHEDALNIRKQRPIFTFQMGTDLLAEVKAKSIHSCVIGLLRLITTISDLLLIFFRSFLHSVGRKCKFPQNWGKVVDKDKTLVRYPEAEAHKCVNISNIYHHEVSTQQKTWGRWFRFDFC